MKHTKYSKYRVYYEQTPVTDYKKVGDNILLLCNSLIEETIILQELYNLIQDPEHSTYMLESGEEVFLQTINHINKTVIFQKENLHTKEYRKQKSLKKVGLCKNTSYYKNLKGWNTSITVQ